MSQNSVYIFLKENKGKWFSSADIAKHLDVNSSTISRSLQRLRKHKDIYYKENGKKGTFLYKVE